MARTILLLMLVDVAKSGCLPEAIAADKRINLINPAGDSYPLGIFTGRLGGFDDVQRGTTAVLSVLLEEIYGYNLTNFFLDDSPQAAAAMAGCSNPDVVSSNPELAGCEDEEEPRVHLGLAMILNQDYYLPYWKSRAPISLGGMGHESFTSFFFAAAVDESAEADGSPSLSYYKNWNASRYNPAQYFDSFDVIPASLVRPCSAGPISNARIMAQYVAVSGDYDGLHSNGTGICFQESWFLSPACRQNVSRCVPLIAGFQPQPWLQALQKAAAFSMPFAIGITGRLENPIPFDYKVAFFALMPRSRRFFPLRPMPIEFPHYDEVAWSNGDYRTMFRSSDLTKKFVSWNLEQVAPRVKNLVERVTFPQSIIDAIFEVAENTSDWEGVACQWLLSNRDIWEEWIPDETVCVPGFGLYDPNTSEYVDSRTQDRPELTCIACASGRFSAEIFDDKGITYICSECPLGTYQASGAALRCQPCPAGEYQDRTGGQSCKRCSIGLYQDQLGRTVCQNCSADSTTVGLGSQSQLECGCQEGHIEIARDLGVPQCTSCQTGMSCPKFSTTSSLTSGTSELGEDFVPRVQEGFMTLAEEPLSVYMCRGSEECPGGVPGTCTGGRNSIACATCGTDEFWNDDQCKACTPWIRAIWISVLSLGALLLPFCRFSQMTIKSRTAATLAFAILCIVEIALNLLQSMGIVGQIPLKWPVAMAWSFTFLEVFAFDIHELGLSCIAGGNSLMLYVAQAAFLPSLLIWVTCVHLLLKATVSPRSRLGKITLKGPHLLLVLGQIVMMCFEALSNLSLMPWMCYKHPNGLHSNLQFASILCSTDEHIAMSICGSVLCAFVVAFLSLCTWVLRKLPRWSMEGNEFPIIASQFLTDQFRLSSWWFGLLTLLRGPVLSLVITVFTNQPKSQIMLITMAMISYLVTLLLAWPFKIPLLNALEAACSWSIIVLVLGGSLYLPASDSEATDFSSISTLLALVVAFFLIGASLVVATAHAIGFCLKRKERRFYLLDLGRLPVHADLAALLVQTSLGVAELDLEIFEERPVDLRQSPGPQVHHHVVHGGGALGQ